MAIQSLHHALKHKYTALLTTYESKWTYRGYIAISLGLMAVWGGANAQQPFNMNENLAVYTRQGETNIQLPGQQPFPIPAGQVGTLNIEGGGIQPRLLPSARSSSGFTGVGYFKGESAVHFDTVKRPTIERFRKVRQVSPEDVKPKNTQRFLPRDEDLVSLAVAFSSLGSTVDSIMAHRNRLKTLTVAPDTQDIISKYSTQVEATPALNPAMETLIKLAAADSAASTNTSGSIGYIAVRAAYTGTKSANPFEITYKEITESTNGAFTLDNFGGATYASSGLSVGKLSPDSGYSYTSLGSWADGGSFEQKGSGIIGVYATSPNAGTFVLGTATPSADIPSTGNAVYNGHTQGVDNLGVATTGTAVLTINFATQNVDAALTSSHSSGSTLTGNFNNMTINNGHFSAFGGLDSIDGNFYGPAAQEAGGAWKLSNGSGSEQAIGVFRAK